MKARLLLALILSTVLILPGCSSKVEGNKADVTTIQETAEKTADNQQSEATPTSGNTDAGSNDLIASLPLLPGGLVESADKGLYVDLVKAIDEIYTDGSIKIEVNPIARAQQLLIDKQVDFYLPKILTQYTDTSKLPYKVLSKPNGKISFVLYSNVNKKLTKDDLDKALEKGGDFPYKLESSPSLKDSFKYPYAVSNSIDESVKKLDTGRIDGFIWAQEDVDGYLNSAKVKTVYRSQFYDFDDVIAVANNEKSEKTNKILTDCITKLEASGKLKEIYDKIHSPYKEWQPSEMGW